MADEKKKEHNGEEKKDEKEKAPEPKDMIVVTHHKAMIGGKEIGYTATTGTMVLKEEASKEGKFEGEKPRASIFFVAYTLDGVDDPSTRPITFAFNGGPGSSSVWLHLGMLGPRRIDTGDQEMHLAPPYDLIDNEHSLLDRTDLVFIDPVSTGFSRAVPGEKPDQFHGFKKDIESVGDFIRLYVTRYKRWRSPKFLAGESYGTTRAAGLSGYLQERHGMYLNGIVLVSAVLNFQTIRFAIGNDLPYILFLPTYAATAWYHGKLPSRLQADLGQTIGEVRDFALGEYTLALMKGASLGEPSRSRIARKVARYTGLSVDFVERSNLRIEIMSFCKELLRSEGRTIGRFDSRFKGRDRNGIGVQPEYDPSYPVVQGPYTAALNDYVRAELEFESDLPYEVLTGRVHPWSYAEHQNRYVNVAETLRKAMCMNPKLHVFVANGFYDLATPFLATEYTFSHLELDSELQANITMGYYEAGHMMYVHEPSLAKAKTDLTRFFESVLGNE